jgi:hypothetical protein
MEKGGSISVGEKINITRHTIDTDDFIERLLRQESNLIAHFNIRPTRVLMGTKDFSAMMNCIEIRRGLGFTFNTSYNYGREILGLRVEVIPWMRGILVMP